MTGLNQTEQTGIIPRFCEDLFKRINNSPKVLNTLIMITTLFHISNLIIE